MIGARRVLAAVTLGTAVTAMAASAAIAGPRSHGGHGHKTTAERVFTLAPDPAGNPEGIAVDARSKTFFVGVTVGGAIYSGTLGSDTVAPFIDGTADGSAVGMKVRKGKLYVAGGATGLINVYDIATKALVGTFDTGAGGFLNDLVVTGNGDVFVTDSFRPMLWHVTAAQVAAGTGTPQALDVSGSITFTDGAFNLNGIVSKDHRRLIVVQSNTGQLWRIDLAKGLDAIKKITEIKGVSVPGGDGMILDRGRLVVVQGGPPAQLNFIKLKHGQRKGRSEGTVTSANLHGPSTVARLGKFYLVVNADFALAASPPFTVAGIPRDAHRHGGHGGHGGH
jgi:Cu-Zn family superoxide dismutase